MIPNMKRLMTYGLMTLLTVGIGCSGGGGDGSGGGKGDGSGGGTGGGKGKKPTVAFVTNGIASFWVVAEAGAKAGAKDVNAEVLIKMPADGVGDQKRMLEDLLTQGVDGVAVSPIDPKGQKDILDEVGNNTIYITHDSDAPETNRVCYIGMDNYDAG
ncbi:MAG TPA: substrate-binding domain-containing protein, partial [Planctomycetaceae bacterium]|nr:substrate-binding domain-containing protein [Planctomycetaceae bacterium]